MNRNYILLFVILIILLIIFGSMKCRSIEGYRDPIYLNRAKLMYDWYPRANGSIYGFPVRYGGSWHILSGYPYYWKAY